ncbi:MAG: acetamidase [Firmicutes bacterium]|nr:acetamidase [Bacillota bacterium]
MKFEDKGNVIYAFSSRHAPVAELAPGEILVVETADLYAGQIHRPGQDWAKIDREKLCPATGPFYIAGAETGDVLEVNILDIKTAPQGVIALAPGTPEPEIHVVSIGEGGVTFPWGLTYPMRPAVGIIGVAPEEGEEPTDRPGRHGGSLGAGEISPGSRVFLPVFHDGALLALGGVNALAGDGKMGGASVEVSAEVKISVAVHKDMELDGPRVETERGIWFYASAETLEQAAVAAGTAAVNYLRQAGLSPAQAQMTAGAVGHLGISQVVNPLRTAKFFLPRLEGLHK